MATKIVTISGAGGVGKTSIVQAQLDRLCGLVKLIPSTTTREPRKNDITGEYEYIAPEEFTKIERADGFLWPPVEIGKQRYGTRKSAFEEIFSDIKRVSIMILTPDTIPIVKKYVFEKFGLRFGINVVYSFYILAPSQKTIFMRMWRRGDSDTQIKARLNQRKEWDEYARNSGAFNEFINNPEGDPLQTSLYVMKRIIELCTP